LPPGCSPPEADPNPDLVIDIAIFFAPAANHEGKLLERARFRHGRFGWQYPKSRRNRSEGYAGNKNPTIDYHVAAPFPISREPCTNDDDWNAGVFPQRLVAVTEISLAVSVSPASRAIA